MQDHLFISSDDLSVHVELSNELFWMDIIWKYSATNLGEIFLSSNGEDNLYHDFICDEQNVISNSSNQTKLLLDNTIDTVAIHAGDYKSPIIDLVYIRSYFKIPMRISDAEECNICMEYKPSVIIVTGQTTGHAICQNCRISIKMVQCPFTYNKILYCIDAS